MGKGWEGRWSRWKRLWLIGTTFIPTMEMAVLVGISHSLPSAHTQGLSAVQNFFTFLSVHHQKDILSKHRSLQTLLLPHVEMFSPVITQSSLPSESPKYDTQLQVHAEFPSSSNHCTFTEVTASEEGLFSRFYGTLTVVSKLNTEQNVIRKITKYLRTRLIRHAYCSNAFFSIIYLWKVYLGYKD